MDAGTRVLRSIPLDQDGTPKDKSLAPATPSTDGVVHLDVVGGTANVPRTPATDTAIQPPPVAKPKARYLGSAPRSTVYRLVIPLEYDGKEYREVTIRRLTGEDFERYAAFTQQGASENDAMLSLMTDTPIDVIHELDLEDRLEMTVAARPFMPRRFQMMFPEMPALETGAEAATGEDTSSNPGTTSSPTENFAQASQTGPISQAS